MASDLSERWQKAVATFNLVRDRSYDDDSAVCTMSCRSWLLLPALMLGHDKEYDVRCG